MLRPVSVVIPVFARDAVFPTIALLRAQDYASVLRFVVVDNGNAPDLSARLASLAGTDCTVVRFEENRGGSAAYIAGMELAMRDHADTDRVWLLDDDAVPDAETLPALMREMDRLVASDPMTASLGSAVCSVSDPDRIVECGAGFSLVLTKAIPHLRGASRSSVGTHTERVAYAAACSLLVRKAAVRACGFWEDVFIHCDDIEWGLRVARSGWHNYATTRSAVVHPEFDPKKAGAWICYYDARNQYWLASRYGLLYVMTAWVKNAAKNTMSRLSGRNLDRVAYRQLAWRDFRAGVRRLRRDLVALVETRV